MIENMKKSVLYVLALGVTISTLLLFFVKFNYNSQGNYCNKTNVVHVCIICLDDFCDRINLYTMFKSVFFYRNDPIHVHVIADNLNDRFTKTLFDTWSVGQVYLSRYNIDTLSENFQKAARKNHEVLIVALPEMLPIATKKVLLVDHDLFIDGDVYNLWRMFNKFKEDQVIGLLKQRDTSVVLVNVDRLRKTKLSKIRKYTNKLNLLQSLNGNKSLILINASLKYVKWNRIQDINEGNNNSVKLNTLKSISNVMDGVIPRLPTCGGEIPDIFLHENTIPQCRQYPELRNYYRKTLLFARKFTYTPQKHDVTLITHLTVVKLPLLEDIGTRWKGPISASIYLAEDELDYCIKFIKNSKTLSSRTDIGYHIIFKLGRFYPVNALRNVALRNVLTDYILLIDVDFLPMLNLEDVIKMHVSKMDTMYKKALVIPAFSSDDPNNVIPKTKEEWIKQWDGKMIFQFHHKSFPMGHRSTNYVKLRRAKHPYTVKWEPQYEPYVVLLQNVSEYDERFFGYGHNKISHILTLVAQEYEFIVLPNTFLIHKFHKPFGDRSYSTKVRSYMYCLDTLIYHHTNELNSKYGTDFKFEDLLF